MTCIWFWWKLEGLSNTTNKLFPTTKEENYRPTDPSDFCPLKRLHTTFIFKFEAKQSTYYVGFVVLTTVVWYITLCSPLKVNRRFGGTYRLHLHGLRISRARKQRSVCNLSRSFLAWLILGPWRLWRYANPKRRLTFNGLHGVMSQEIVLTLPPKGPNSIWKVFPKIIISDRSWLQD
jgi:hypothetical protein